MWNLAVVLIGLVRLANPMEIMVDICSGYFSAELIEEFE